MKPLQPNRSAGFSLVELMVALVVSLVLLAGVLQILLSNRDSFSFQRDMAGLQENGRLASFVIENVVAHAGYRVELDRNDLFDAGGVFANGAFVTGTSGGADGNDSLRLRFQAGTGHDGCNGPDAGVAELPLSNLGMTDLELYVNDQNSLLCRDRSSGSVPQPIVENVARFKVTYGIDTDRDGSVNTYANSVGGANADNVVSVRLQLLLESEDNITPTATSHNFAFAYGNDFTATNRHAYQLVDQVVALRNAIP